jgi:hypothetical protein
MNYSGLKESGKMVATYIDERTEQINGQVSFLFLMLTHLALGGIIFYKRYILGLPMVEYVELNWVLGLSLGGYWAFRLFTSGILPVVSFKKMSVIYLIAVAFIGIPTFLLHGWPEPERWYEVLYPFIGVAVLMGFYSLVAYFGKQRLEKEISE